VGSTGLSREENKYNWRISQRLNLEKLHKSGYNFSGQKLGGKYINSAIQREI